MMVMKYFLIAVVVLFSSNLYAANEGSGPINFSGDFYSGYNEYLQYVKDDKKKKYVFVTNESGWWDWGYANTEKGAESFALKNCNDSKMKDYPGKCKVFARGERIVWKWSDIPDNTSGGRDILYWKNVDILVGQGKETFSNNTIKYYNEYLQYVTSLSDFNSNKFCSYFSVSENGESAGYFNGNCGNSNCAKFCNEIKAKAIASCMTMNMGEQCYLYDENTKIIWQE